MEPYRNIHKGDDIYIIASGKSADFVDPSFFDGKITIGINQSYNRFLTTYLVRKEPEYLSQSLAKLATQCTIFVSIGRCGDANTINRDYVSTLPEKDRNRIVLFDHDPNCLINLTGLPEDNKIVTTYSTITSGIHIAAYMGAKNIILLGHDCGTLDNDCNFVGYHSDNSYKIVHKNGQKDYKIWLTKIEGQTIKLKQLLKEKYGCSVHSLNPFINFGLEGHIYKATQSQSQSQSQSQVQQLINRNGYIKASYSTGQDYHIVASKLLAMIFNGKSFRQLKAISSPKSNSSLFNPENKFVIDESEYNPEIYRLIGLKNSGTYQISSLRLELSNITKEIIVLLPNVPITIPEDNIAFNMYYGSDNIFSNLFENINY